MALALRARWGADLVLAVGPAPAGAAPGEAPGRLHIALATPADVVTSSVVFASHPAIQRPRAAKEALNLTRLWLLKQPT
jgi:hypothetical protein